MSISIVILCCLVALLCIFFAVIAHRNAAYCALDAHEDTYAVILLLAALTIVGLLLR